MIWGSPGVMGIWDGWGGGGQFMSNLGPGWMRIAPCKEESFQVSKRDSGGKRELARGKGELARGETRDCAITY